MTDSSTKAQVEALLSEIKTLIQRGKLQQAWKACGAILAHDPGNELVQKLKAELEKTGKIMNVGRQEKIAVKDLRCPSCRSPIKIVQEDSEVTTCANCSSVLDLTAGELAVLSKVASATFSPQSFLSLGKIATFKGKKYQVIGRICFSSTIREWDPEDDTYYTEPWNFDEWTLVGENKEYFHLAEDQEGYGISQPFTPTAPSIPQPGAEYLTLSKDGSPQRILEDTTAKIEHFEGEFTWLPKLGETVRSVEYQEVLMRYSVEWRLSTDGKQDIEEVEFFSSQAISRLELAVAFNEEEIIAEEHQALAINEEYSKWSWAFFAGAVVCLLLLIGSCSGSTSKIADYQVSLSEIPEEGTIRGPFQLSNKGSIHKLHLSSSIADNSWAWGGVELLDSTQSSINAVEGDFWRESGYDGGEHWSERNTSKDYYFRLSSPGVYYARLFVEKGSAGSGELRLEVSEGLTLSRYYLVGFLFCLGFGVAIRRYKTLNPVYVVVGILAIGALILSHVGDDD